jgi:ABC-type branched-subunit amino acid transport system substrate-binding protein
LLVPLSGPQAELGQSLLEASQMALYDLGTNDLALIPQNTGGTPTRAAEAARAAIDDGARLLIGPVFGAELEAVRPVAAARHVPVLSLSNNSRLADGNNFILGFTPGEQVARVLGFAKGRGAQRVAALIPSSPYGEAVMDSLAQTTVHLGLDLVRVDRYAPEADAGATAQAFLAELAAAGGADAVLLPDGGAKLKALAEALVATGLDVQSTKLLGTALWEGAGPALAGGWYAGYDQTQRRAFNARFARSYGHPPAPIASLAYDATALAAVLAKNGGGDYPVARLADAKGFAGVDGVFRLRPTGQVERGLAVFSVTAAGTGELLDPAPRSFISPGQ